MPVFLVWGFLVGSQRLQKLAYANIITRRVLFPVFIQNTNGASWGIVVGN